MRKNVSAQFAESKKFQYRLKIIDDVQEQKTVPNYGIKTIN